MSFQVAVLFNIHTSSDTSCRSTVSCFGFVSIVPVGHSHRHVVLSHFGLNLHFANDIWYGTSLRVNICHLDNFSGEVSVKVSGPFLIGLCVFLLLKFKNPCIFWMILFYQMCLWTYFLPVCVLSFYSLQGLFQSRNLNGNEVQLINYFLDPAFGVVSKMLLPHSKSSRFSPTLLSGSFTFLKSMFVIHFELILIKRLRSVSRFILFSFQVITSYSNTIYSKPIVF